MIFPGMATAVVGGQFGSEAKGLIAAWLAQFSLPLMACTTNAGAQAGHTTVLGDGTKFVCYHLPTVGVLTADATLYLNAGSIIDLDLLDREIHGVATALNISVDSIKNRLVIHPNAAVISSDCKAIEAGTNGTTHLASTGKGVGAALAQKIMRQPEGVIGRMRHKVDYQIRPLDLTASMEERNTPVTVEIPQGTGLSINAAPFYPFCTSRDCWVGQGLTDAGIHPAYLTNTIMVCRTFPIRVGHTYGPEGQKVGDSGRFYADSTELEWADLPGVEPEITTVTKRVRRIATWSNTQYEEALRLNRPDLVALTFVNYLASPETLERQVAAMRRIERERVGLVVGHLYSWGPRVDQCSYSFDEAVGHTAARG